MLEPPMPPVPPALPPGYSEALYWARAYNRSYARHSKVYTAYGPIPLWAPSSSTPTVSSDAPAEIDGPAETGEPPIAEKTKSGMSIIFSACLVILAIVVLCAWLESSLVPSMVSTPTLSADTSYSIAGGPSVSAAFIDRVLSNYGSPVAGKGQVIYDDGVKYGIDPVFALAFFMHESSFGLAGEARSSLSIGNLRCLGSGYEDLSPSCQNDYAWFPTWDDGIEAWYRLIKYGYVEGRISSRCPCITIAQIIPVYAPNADHNDEGAYIQSVERAVAIWRSGKVVVA